MHAQPNTRPSVKDNLPEWIEVDGKKMEGQFKRVPERSELDASINENLIVELYSK